MRVTMIHAIAESIPPVRMAFDELFPEAQVVNVLDEGLLLDFDGQLRGCVTSPPLPRGG